MVVATPFIRESHQPRPTPDGVRLRFVYGSTGSSDKLACGVMIQKDAGFHFVRFLHRRGRKQHEKNMARLVAIDFHDCSQHFSILLVL